MTRRPAALPTAALPPAARGPARRGDAARRRAARVALALACAASGVFPQMAAAADDLHTDERPLALRAVMKDLGRHMQTVVDAISREDWARVAATAPRIGRHDEPPPAEKVRIMTFLGADVPRFKGHDDASHAAADAMRAAAERGDGPAVIAEFGRVQSACLGCHQQFRQSLLKQFYGAR